MMSRWQWLVGLLTRRLWFKASLYGFAAIVTALVAILLAPVVPDKVASVLGTDAVESLLKILASSMLAVATFSLGTMVAAFAVASSAATPRVSKLLVEDPVSQNVLSTFIGAFIFSLVGLIALSTGVYGTGGRFVLFVVTVVVIAAVLVTFFRWIDYLSNLGRLSETLERVEQSAAQAMRARCKQPYLCCSPLRSVPSSAAAHNGKEIGYVQHLDFAVLQDAAEKANGQIWISRVPGSFTDPSCPLFWASWDIDDETRKGIYGAFLVGSARSFEQDPRFGVIVLSEIASRALSLGINDPGTAIDVIGRIIRVLAIWAETTAEMNPPRYPRVFVPEIAASDLLDDAFGPISRDAAGTLEVGIRLQKGLGILARLLPERFGAPAKSRSEIALQLSESGLQLEAHKAILRKLAAEVQALPEAVFES